jgi:predicted DCC family thiol-disulfide oxidoreductase YuxK
MQTTLHLQTAEGTWLTGLDANVRAWSHTRWGLPWQVLRLPLIRQVADLSYNSWAQRRYRRLYGCADCGPAN